MKRIIVCLIVMFLGMSCQNSRQEIKVIDSQEKMVIVNNHEVLDNEIIVMLKEYMDIIKRRTDSTRGLCYTVEFYKGSPGSIITEKDTAIMFSYYALGRDYAGYKGIIFFIDDYPVAIIDSGRIGTAFYSENDLIRSPLNKFKRVEVDTLRIGYLLRLKNGKLKNAFGGIRR